MEITFSIPRGHVLHIEFTDGVAHVFSKPVGFREQEKNSKNGADKPLVSLALEPGKPPAEIKVAFGTEKERERQS